MQDVEVPLERAAEFLRIFHAEVGMAPIWVCPLRLRKLRQPWTLYELDPEGIVSMRAYLEMVSANWERALGRLKDFVETGSSE